MRWNLIIKIFFCVFYITAFILYSGGIAGSQEGKNTEEPTMIFDFDNVACPIRFVNFQRNSLLTTEAKARWRFLWSKSYTDVDPNLLPMPFAVVTAGNYVGVKSASKVIVYDSSGAFQFLRGTANLTPVIFGQRALAFVHPSYQLRYQEYNGEPLGHVGVIPKLKNWFGAVLLKPSREEVLAVIQYTGGPRREPKYFHAYKFNIKNGSLIWDVKSNGIVSQALLTKDGGKLILAHAYEMLILNTADGEIAHSFKTGYDYTVNSSLDGDDNILAWLENTEEEDEQRILKAFSPDGEELWIYTPIKPQVKQPPACGSNGEVYIVDARFVKCLENGELKWQYLLKSSAETWLTITQNGYIIALNGSFLTILDANGEKQYEDLFTKTDESFEAPVAVDANGRLYVAGNKKFYCFKTID